MADEMPHSSQYEGLSRKVLEWVEGFPRVVSRLNEPDFSEADWAPLKTLVDVEKFRRVGVFPPTASRYRDGRSTPASSRNTRRTFLGRKPCGASPKPPGLYFCNSRKATFATVSWMSPIP